MNDSNYWEQIRRLAANMNDSDLPTFLDKLNRGGGVALFGAGAAGIRAAPILKEELPVTAFCDNSIEKQGREIEGLLCIAPPQLAADPKPFVLVCTDTGYDGIHQQLLRLQVPHASLDAYAVYRHFTELEQVYDVLDDASREVFAAVLLYRLTGEPALVEKCFVDCQYFAPARFRYLADPKGIFVDCGAYVGDTVEMFIRYAQGIFDKIYAFEPYERSFAAMLKRTAFLKEIWALSEDQIICEPCGVGRHSQLKGVADRDRIAASVTLENDPHGGRLVRTVDLDTYMRHRPNEKIAFIKADIEGAEWDMLHGAARMIQRDKPRLAICIYHSIFDFFRIPLYLKSLVPEYRLEIRHHSLCKSETVLYCSV